MAKYVITHTCGHQDTQTEAKWWIDNRLSMPKPLVNAKTGETDQSAARTIITTFKLLFI